ncbi:unnamed protein product [Pleuronectes platessa]|uniref:Uncharacterized protein n=1 Tax=Pleuronectes platessa TaxID=8262 RepID=A0A9N7Z6I2_PLEPL|nr:unnamed protein product [Pleuronectes platessa]
MLICIKPFSRALKTPLSEQSSTVEVDRLNRMFQRSLGSERFYVEETAQIEENCCPSEGGGQNLILNPSPSRLLTSFTFRATGRRPLPPPPSLWMDRIVVIKKGDIISAALQFLSAAKRLHGRAAPPASGFGFIQAPINASKNERRKN